MRHVDAHRVGGDHADNARDPGRQALERKEVEYPNRGHAERRAVEARIGETWTADKQLEVAQEDEERKGDERDLQFERRREAGETVLERPGEEADAAVRHHLEKPSARDADAELGDKVPEPLVESGILRHHGERADGSDRPARQFAAERTQQEEEDRRQPHEIADEPHLHIVGERRAADKVDCERAPRRIPAVAVLRKGAAEPDSVDDEREKRPDDKWQANADHARLELRDAPFHKPVAREEKRERHEDGDGKTHRLRSVLDEAMATDDGDGHQDAQQVNADISTLSTHLALG